MAKAEALYRLQTLDSQLDSAYKRMREIDAALAGNAAVVHAKAELATAEKVLHVATSELKSIELDVQSLDEKMRSEEQRLYGGQIKDTKEMLDTQKELESLKKRHATLDDTQMSAMEKAEDARITEANIRKALSEATQRWAEDNQHLRQERIDLATKSSGIAEQRQAAVAAIPRAELDAYIAVRTKKPNGVAVALIKNNSCSQCGAEPSSMHLQQARTGSTLTYCGTCGRILYGA